jgi:hypothetical protein
LGDSSSHWHIVSLAHEYHIAPSVLMQESDRMLWTMGRYMVWLNSQQSS